MMTPKASVRSRSTLLLAFVVTLVALAGTLGAHVLLSPEPVESPRPPIDDPAAPPDVIPPPSQQGDVPLEERWNEVERLISEDKYEAAYTAASEILATARELEDDEELARALIRCVQLRTGLHGYETAVRFLVDEPWPQDPLQRAVVELFFAHSLQTYFQAYSWEINQRERVASDDEVDLKQWTRDQIAAAAAASFGRVWAQRETWGAEPLGRIAEFIDQNNYPPRIRGTLRDAVSYLWAEQLASSLWWSPAESNDVFRLDAAALATSDLQALGDSAPGQDGVHPLARMTYVLADLEAWHAGQERPEAAFEARRERLHRLWQAITSDHDRKTIRRALKERLDDLGRQYRWWSLGMSTLAEMVRDSGEPEAEVRARQLALLGLRQHEDSVGGQRCRHIVAGIEAPGFSTQAMTTDGAGRRSIQVRHRNLDRLHFRAYALDLRHQIETSKDYNLLPGYREVPEILNSRTPAARWSVELPATPDFRDHSTFVTPPLEDPGLYLVIASARRDFAIVHNRLEAVNLVVSDLVMVTRRVRAGVEVTVRSGASGQPRPGAEVSLYRFDWHRGHRRVATARAGVDGRVELELPRNQSHFLFATLGEELAVDLDHLYHQNQGQPQAGRAALTYTDRSVYRPQQKVFWKVVAYQGGGKTSSFETEPGARFAVHLQDANRETVETVKVTTNAFGTASGEFTIPTGRLLGQWYVATSRDNLTPIRVEEYKRPTFEVTVDEPADALRLNRRAEISGEARYYFGLPVVTGEVRWQVTREPIYPYWWYWYGRSPSPGQTIASGTSGLDEEGRFEIAFTPEADERERDSGVSFRYRLGVEVTDEGGETRSGDRSFRLGFVSVETRITGDQQFLLAGEPADLTLRRTDLDGVGRAGEGTWRVVALQQPEATLLPADQPWPEPTGVDAEAHRTPGDALRPRWNPQYTPAATLRLWADAEVLARGRLDHDAKGLATLALPRLAPGAYRVHYATTDPFGAEFDTTHELIVAAEGSTPLALPAVLMTQDSSVEVGGTARILVHSGLSDQPMVLERFRWGRRIERRVLSSEAGLQLIELPIEARDRGGFGLTLTAVRDHQLVTLTDRVFVPWSDRELRVEFATFRDRLRPGDTETWRVTVHGADDEALAAGAAEVLAYMYDKSLDIFAPHSPPSPLALYPNLTSTQTASANLGLAGTVWQSNQNWASLPGYPHLGPDQLRFLSGYGIGGLGGPRWIGGRLQRNRLQSLGYVADLAEGVVVASEVAASVAPPAPASPERKAKKEDAFDAAGAEAEPAAEVELRTDFSETAFWEPHLLTGEDGSVSFELTVPDSVTEWNVWVHAVTRDLRGGSLKRQTRTVKDLLVRPYLPRFLRENDRAELRMVVQNAGEIPLSGHLDFDVLDPEGEGSLLEAFGLSPAAARGLPFHVEPGGSHTVEIPISVPPRVGPVAFQVVAKAGDLSDGERRPVPVLPGRMHLAQSRFVTLKDADRRVLSFPELSAGTDPTLIHDQLVVTIDAQLFYGVLNALPYLIDYPYECTEQTLNRFLSTGIVSSVFDRYPDVARMAKEMSARDTHSLAWAEDDPNRKMALVETPWLRTSRGGDIDSDDLIKVLDPRVARAQRQAALAKLEKSQTSLGAFPWWPGGPPSPYMTLYLLNGFSRALEFEVEVPKPMVVRAWSYMHRHYLDEVVRDMMARDCCWEFVTFLNYVLSSYPDDSWSGGVFTADERRAMLDFSFRHWRQHSPLSKAMLALTLNRSDRHDDAVLVFDSIMDSAKTTAEDGTYWAPEDRAWLWYNDTIETHAFALRALSELDPDDQRRHGMVQWLLINKQLNHWKSTRATAEVIYSMIHYLEREGALGVREAVDLEIGPIRRQMVFEPDRYTGHENQVVVPGPEVEPSMGEITVSKETPGFLFASATWHFSTEELPAAGEGDLFHVTRTYFRRIHDGREWTLEPLAEGTELAPGDQLEVHLSIESRHAAEYVHLRDPRGAGFEPETLHSRYKWDLGIAWYEEVRDSGTNFFFEWLPAGEYTFKYRLRANLGGTFRVGPATLQSMYAPEFAAYSSGAMLRVE